MKTKNLFIKLLLTFTVFYFTMHAVMAYLEGKL